MQQNASTEQTKPAQKSRKITDPEIKAATPGQIAANGIRRQPGKTGYPQELKDAAIEDALSSIMAGELLSDIAARHKVSTRSLKAWLLSMESMGDDRYRIARDAYIDSQLAEAEELLDNCLNHQEDIPRANLHLAYGREKVKHAQWVAQRRDARYMDKREVTQVSISITAALELANGRVIDSE